MSTEGADGVKEPEIMYSDISDYEPENNVSQQDPEVRVLTQRYFICLKRNSSIVEMISLGQRSSSVVMCTRQTFKWTLSDWG